MRCSPTFHRWALSVGLAAALSLVPAAGALAASPKAGKLYTGPTSASYNGFTRTGQLHGLQERQAAVVLQVGRRRLYRARRARERLDEPREQLQARDDQSLAHRHVHRQERQIDIHGQARWKRFTKVTTSTVTGRFKNATTATGTISFTQKITKTCSGKVSFTATLGPAPGALHKLSPASGTSVTSNPPTLSWSPSAHATAYRYCIATSENGPCIGGWITTNTTTHATLGALAPGSYYWQVIATSVHGTVAADNGGWSSFTVPAAEVNPHAGSWVATSLSGPVTGSGGSLNRTDSVTVTSIFFNVTGDQATVSGFGFTYNDLGEPFDSCIGRGSTVDQVAAPIARGQFSTPAASTWSDPMDYGTFTGTFDSPTSAHGTAWFRDYIGAYNCKYIGYANTGNFSWTATPQP